jgi:hypothetical protein
MVRQFGPSSTLVSVVCGACPAKMKEPKGVANFSDPPWTVGSTWAAAQWHGGELWWWLGLEALTCKISTRGDSFYRAL